MTQANNDAGEVGPLDDLVASFLAGDLHPTLWLHEIDASTRRLGAELAQVDFEPLPSLGQRMRVALASPVVVEVWARARLPNGGPIKMARVIRVGPMTRADAPAPDPAPAPASPAAPTALEQLAGEVQALARVVARVAQAQAPQAPPQQAPQGPQWQGQQGPMVSPTLADAWNVVNGAVGLVQKMASEKPAGPTHETIFEWGRKAAEAAAGGSPWIPTIADLGAKALDRLGGTLDLGKAYMGIKEIEAKTRLEEARKKPMQPDAVSEGGDE